MPSVRKHKPTGKYEVRFYEGGKRKSRYFDKKRDAEIEVGKLAKINTKNAKGNLTVKEWLDTYLEGQKRRVTRGTLSPNTFKIRDSSLRKYVIEPAGSMYLDALSRKWWKEFFGRTEEATRAFQIAFETLRTAFNEAVEEGLMEANPIAGLPGSKSSIKPQHDSKARQIIDGDEIAKLLKEAAKSDYPSYTYPLLLLAIHTGMRQGELFGLEWEDVDFNKRRIYVKQSAGLDLEGGLIKRGPKTRSGRRELTVSDTLLMELREWASKGRETASTDILEGLVFPNSMGQILRSGNFMERVYRPLLEKCGLEEIDFHSLRHTNASHMIDAGISLKVIQYRLGHASIKTTLDIYGHLLKESQDDAAGVMDEFS